MSPLVLPTFLALKSADERTARNRMPPAVNQSNAKHYRQINSVTDYKEFPERSHYTVGQDGWEEVADYALEWAVEHTKRPAA